VLAGGPLTAKHGQGPALVAGHDLGPGRKHRAQSRGQLLFLKHIAGIQGAAPCRSAKDKLCGAPP
jgi:hypothetical protein